MRQRCEEDKWLQQRGAGGDGGRARAEGGLGVDVGKKKGCKLILENPHGGILVKHIHTGILPSCWDRCKVSVISVEQRLLHLPTSVEKPLISSSSSSPLLGGWCRFLLVQISAGFQVKTASSWRSGCGSCSAGLFCFASSPKTALGWSLALVPSQQANLALEGSRYDPAFSAHPFAWGSILLGAESPSRGS